MKFRNYYSIKFKDSEKKDKKKIINLKNISILFDIFMAIGFIIISILLYLCSPIYLNDVITFIFICSIFTLLFCFMYYRAIYSKSLPIKIIMSVAGLIIDFFYYWTIINYDIFHGFVIFFATNAVPLLFLFMFIEFRDISLEIKAEKET